MKYMKPIFLPSPSGRCCAVVCTDSLTYFVVLVNPSSSSSSSDKMVVIDQGHCSDFGWVGRQDQFIVKTPPFISSEKDSSINIKRSSISDLLFAAKKDNKQFCDSLIELKCIDYSPTSTSTSTSYTCRTLKLLLDYSKTGKLSPEQIVDLFSGPIIGINIDPTKGLLGKESIHGLVDSDKEVDRLYRKASTDMKPGSDSLVHQFFCLVNYKSFSSLSSTTATSKGKHRSVVAQEETSEVVVDSETLTLVPLGPLMRFCHALIIIINNNTEVYKWFDGTWSTTYVHY